MYFLGLDFILFFFICKGQFLKVCSKESWSFLWQGGRRVRWTLFIISFPFGGVSGRIFVCAEADILSQCNCGLCLLGRSRFEIFWLKPWGLFFSPNLFHLCAAVLHFCPSLVEIECSPYLTSAQEWDLYSGQFWQKHQFDALVIGFIGKLGTAWFLALSSSDLPSFLLGYLEVLGWPRI